ncbi:hypothetical protein KGF56_000409 [Candida oxycetoniae]|uniref:Protein OCA4 n=1 Tax=Candida oxycetoniae TaxID=497107 RepID=A0AAI9X070_9ASCO|nr:uncharacterized protein KGF56_000409 [Candida oxycetoniae]KAI3406804.2 hypothetical protein KGF56_000409 [Candida oxycetoniae]
MLVSPENFGVVEPGIYRCSKIEVENFQFLETLILKSIVILDAEKPPRLISNFIELHKIELYSLGDLKISNHHHTGISSKTDLEDYELESSINNSNNNNNNNNSSSSSGNSNNNGDTGSSSSKTSSHFPNQGMPTTKIPIASFSLAPRTTRDQWMLIEKNIIVKTFELMLNNKRHPILIVDSTATLIGILRKIQKWNFNSILNEYRIFNGTSNKNNYFAETFLELISVELIPYENRKRSPFSSRRNSMARSRHSSGQAQLLQLQRNLGAHSADCNGEEQFGKRISRVSSSGDLGPDGDAEEVAIAEDIDDADANKEEDNEDGDDDDDDDEYEDDEYDSLDDMDDMDDDLLSASPQIPENLLKFVEQRRHDKQSVIINGQNSVDNDSENGFSSSPRTIQSPNLTNSLGPTSRNNSFTNNESYLNVVRGMDRRRSSGEIIKNIKFRNNAQHRPSLESTSPILLKRKSSRRSSFLASDENNNNNNNNNKVVDFVYYKNLHKHPIKFENVGTIRLKLPPEHRLPEWFVKGRDFWEKNYKSMNNESS